MNLNEHIKRMKNLFKAEHGIVKPLVSEQIHKSKIKFEDNQCVSWSTPKEVQYLFEKLVAMGYECLGRERLDEEFYNVGTIPLYKIHLWQELPTGGYIYLELLEADDKNFPETQNTESIYYYIEPNDGSPSEKNVDMDAFLRKHDEIFG